MLIYNYFAKKQHLPDPYCSATIHQILCSSILLSTRTQYCASVQQYHAFQPILQSRALWRAECALSITNNTITN